MTILVRRGAVMPEQVFGDTVAVLAASGLLSITGALLALRMVAGEMPTGCRWSVLTRIVPAGLLLGATAWLLFLLALKVYFPRLDPVISWPTMLRSWTIVSVGAIVALGIAVRTQRSVQNAALAGSVMAASLS